MSGQLPFFATTDPDRDWPIVAHHLRYQVDSYRQAAVEGTDRPAPRRFDPERARANGFGHGLMGIVVDTPTVVASCIREQIVDLPVDTVFAWASVAGMSEAMVVEHTKVLCTELAPLIADL